MALSFLISLLFFCGHQNMHLWFFFWQGSWTWLVLFLVSLVFMWLATFLKRRKVGLLFLRKPPHFASLVGSFIWPLGLHKNWFKACEVTFWGCFHNISWRVVSCLNETFCIRPFLMHHQSLSYLQEIVFSKSKELKLLSFAMYYTVNITWNRLWCARDIGIGLSKSWRYAKERY